MSNTYIEDLDKAYVSEYDLFLQEFDQKHPQKTASQQQEIKKHRLIAMKRDNALASEENEDIII